VISILLAGRFVLLVGFVVAAALVVWAAVRAD
jgi:hypothetical protein